MLQIIVIAIEFQLFLMVSYQNLRLRRVHAVLVKRLS